MHCMGLDAYVRSVASKEQREHAGAGRQMDTHEVSLDTLGVLDCAVLGCDAL